jgi:hypothetical protein
MRRGLAMLAITVLCSGGLVAVSGGVADAATPTCYGSCYVETTGSTAYAGEYASGLMYILVCDTLLDGDNAYDWYNLGSSTNEPTNRQETSGGYGTCTNESIIPTSEITLEACRDIAHEPDNCSGWLHVEP